MIQQKWTNKGGLEQFRFLENPKTQLNTEKKIKMEETQNELNLGIGTKELTTLKPARVKIESVKIEAVGDKGNKKVVCLCKHPEKEEPINISAVKFEKKDKLEFVGLWVNRDEDKLVRKGSALAVLMNFLNAKTIIELEQKEIDTIEDEKGYLCFKAY